MSKEFDVAIIDNKIVLLDENGTNLTEALSSQIKLEKKFNIFFWLMTTVFASIWLRFVVGFFYNSTSQIAFGVLGAISFFAFLFLSDAKSNANNKVQTAKNQFNKANLECEKEIFDAKKRIKNQENELQALKIDNGFFKKEKSLNE